MMLVNCKTFPELLTCCLCFLSILHNKQQIRPWLPEAAETIKGTCSFCEGVGFVSQLSHHRS
ncbi:hypothetical protein LEMLEM_LOCUS988 [Lemmus lemmus]